MIETPGICGYRDCYLEVMYHVILFLTSECKECECHSHGSTN